MATPFTRVQMETEMSVKLELLGYMAANQGWHGKSHSHPFWELVFVESGEGTLFHGPAACPTQSGDVLLLAPDVEHRFAPGPASVPRHLYVGFSVAGGFPPFGDASLPALDKTLALTAKPALARIVAALQSNPRQAELEARSGELLGVLLRVLSGLAAEAGPTPRAGGRAALLVEKAKAVLAANLGKGVAVAKLAGGFYLSPHHFGDLFRREAGMTVKAYHELLRMEAAAGMLRDPSMQVSEVAAALGYNSLHYFSRQFKRHYGRSPTDFRASPPPR